jgi:hypothetical protein
MWEFPSACSAKPTARRSTTAETDSNSLLTDNRQLTPVNFQDSEESKERAPSSVDWAPSPSNRDTQRDESPTDSCAARHQPFTQLTTDNRQPSTATTEGSKERKQCMGIPEFAAVESLIDQIEAAKAAFAPCA